MPGRDPRRPAPRVSSDGLVEWCKPVPAAEAGGSRVGPRCGNTAAARLRSASTSTLTSSRSFSAPKKPEYGLIPNADWVTVAVPR